MTLDEWLTQAGLSEKQFGEIVKRRQASINRYRHGVQIPDRDTMRAIIDATGGEVTANDFYDLTAA